MPPRGETNFHVSLTWSRWLGVSSRASFVGAPSWEKDENGNGPDAKHETQYHPEILRVAVIVGEDPAHDAVEDVHEEDGTDERCWIHRRGQEVEPAGVSQKRCPAHVMSRSADRRGTAIDG